MKKKFFITTTIPITLNFFKGQLSYLSDLFDITAVSSMPDELRAFGDGEAIATAYIPMVRPTSPVKDLVSLARYVWLFATKRPDIVHGNTPKASFLSMLAAWLTRRPVRIYMCHGLRYQGVRGRGRKLLMAIERLSCRCATEVIPVSFGVRQTLIDDKICSEHKLHIVGCGSAGGIDFSRFDLDAVTQADMGAEAPFRFLFIGRIVRDKGVNELVEAFERLSSERPGVELIVIGSFENDDNPVADSSAEAINTHKFIRYLGVQPDVRPYIRACDMLVLPTYREGLPTVPIESAALERGAIVTDIPGCREVIDDGVTGVMVPPRDADALYRAMLWAVDHPEEVAEMGRRGRQRVIDRYAQPRVWRAYREHYASL